MEKQVFNIRLDKRVSQKIPPHKIEDKLVFGALQCPHCHRDWPKTMKQDRVNRAVRLSHIALDKLMLISHPSKFATHALEMDFGICSVCGQRKNERPVLEPPKPLERRTQWNYNQ